MAVTCDLTVKLEGSPVTPATSCVEGGDPPPLGRLTHRKSFVLIEAPHGEPVQRLVGTADGQTDRQTDMLEIRTQLPEF